MPYVEFTPEEIAESEAFVEHILASRAEMEAGIDPEWNAKYGEKAWLAALVCFGILSPAEGEARLEAYERTREKQEVREASMVVAPDQPGDEGSR